MKSKLKLSVKLPQSFDWRILFDEKKIYTKYKSLKRRFFKGKCSNSVQIKYFFFIKCTPSVKKAKKNFSKKVQKNFAKLLGVYIFASL